MMWTKSPIQFAFAALSFAFAPWHAAQATPTSYGFTLASPSGLNASELSLVVMNEGTLIGDFDLKSNPTGTRTKPGLFGSFGSTENLPVATDLDLSAIGAPQIPTGGTFASEIDVAAGLISISGYQASMKPGGAPGLSLNIGLGTEGFRTQSPTSIYPPGYATLPLGTATVTGLELSQVGGPAAGMLTPLGLPGYSINVLLPVSMAISFEILGNPFEVPGLPLLLPLVGTLTLDGPQAEILAAAEITTNETLPLNLPLPDFTLPLPTLLPPGGMADLVFSLSLSEVAAILEGQLTTRALGVEVPEPGMGIALMLGAWVLFLSTRYK